MIYTFYYTVIIPHNGDDTPQDLPRSCTLCTTPSNTTHITHSTWMRSHQIMYDRGRCKYAYSIQNLNYGLLLTFKMASEEALLNIYTCFVDQNYGQSGENMCRECYKMKDHLELLINELKSSQLLIKILQEEIKSTSIGPKNQDNLTNGAVRSINPMMNLILPSIRTVHGRKVDAPE